MAQEFEKRPDGMPLWKDVSGKNVSCTEKVKVLDENYRELRPYEPAGEPTGNAALDDAVLIGCRADDIRTILKEMISEVESSYPDARPEKEK